MTKGVPGVWACCRAQPWSSLPEEVWDQHGWGGGGAQLDVTGGVQNTNPHNCIAVPESIYYGRSRGPTKMHSVPSKGTLAATVPTVKVMEFFSLMF